VSRDILRKWSTLGPGFLIAFAIAACLTTGGRVQASGAQSPPAASQDQTGYVGSETCLTCHDNRNLHGTPHGNPKIPRSPAAAEGCESCHGPGAAHVNDDAKGFMRNPKNMAPREVSETCVSCHNRTEHAFWQGSSHDARNLGCTTCHAVHEFKSTAGQLVRANQAAVCGTCHKPQVQKLFRSSHMPVREGKMTCSTCHNPHGSSNVRQLRTGNYVNESCLSCHQDKRGPFLWEHAAGRESCSSCHDPHGSNHDRMLVARAPTLCQRCHIGTRHPSTIYEGNALAARSNRLILRGCVNCHQQIHGSNHPSGFSLAR
jgi:DmsE family decaheme c-type cytochrome